jgi:hypothetical protein
VSSTKRIERPGVRAGYDRWADTYDDTPNPLVAGDHELVDEVPTAAKYLGRPLLLLVHAERPSA